MKKIKAEAITHENFAPFGQFYTMDKPQGYGLCGELHTFYPDRITADCNHRVGYSPLTVKNPDRMIITQQEYHTSTWEMILPLNDDMILHVALASAGKPVTEYAKAFIVPANTIRVAPAKTAPVFPALIKPSARPFFNALKATEIDESFFF